VTLSAPVRVRLRYADIETFVERFAPNVTRGGVFIASRSPRPVGDTFPFEVQLATGHVALAGEGKVIWVKEFNPAEPNKPHGMGLQFTALSPASREILQRMLKSKSVAPRGPNAPRGLTAPLSTLAARGTNGSGAARPRVDTNVDLAAEFGLEESSLRRALDRAWGPGPRPAEDELQGLLAPDAAEPATLPQALSELRRMLDPTARRRSTGGFRTLESLGAVAPSPAIVAAAPAAEPTNGTNGTNGVGKHAAED
jgi:uncharacterized protein (TIGR02266 family)